MRLRDSIYSNPIKAIKPIRYGAYSHGKQKSAISTQTTQQVPAKVPFSKVLYPFLLGTFGLMGMASPQTVKAQAPAQPVQQAPQQKLTPQEERANLHDQIEDLRQKAVKDPSLQDQLKAKMDAMIQHLQTDSDISLADLNQALYFQARDFNHTIKLKLLDWTDVILSRLKQLPAENANEKASIEIFQSKMEDYLLRFDSDPQNLAMEEKIAALYNRHVSLNHPKSLTTFGDFLWQAAGHPSRYVRILDVQKEKMLDFLLEEIKTLPQKPIEEQYKILAPLATLTTDPVKLAHHQDAQWEEGRSQALISNIHQKLQDPVVPLIKHFFHTYLTYNKVQVNPQNSFLPYHYEKLLIHHLKGPHGDSLFNACMDELEAVFDETENNSRFSEKRFEILGHLSHPLPQNQKRVTNLILKQLTTASEEACRKNIGPALASHFLQQYYTTGPKPYNLTSKELYQNLKSHEKQLETLCSALENPHPNIPLSPLETFLQQLIQVGTTGKNTAAFFAAHPAQKPSATDLDKLRLNCLFTSYSVALKLFENLPNPGEDGTLKSYDILSTLARYNNASSWYGPTIYGDITPDIEHFQSAILAPNKLSQEILKQVTPELSVYLNKIPNPSYKTLNEFVSLFEQNENALQVLASPQRLAFCETLIKKLSQYKPQNGLESIEIPRLKNNIKWSLHIFSHLKNRPDIWDQAASLYIHNYPLTDIENLRSLFFAGRSPEIQVRVATPQKAQIIAQIQKEIRTLPQKTFADQIAILNLIQTLWQNINQDTLKNHTDEQWPVEKSQTLHHDLYEALYAPVFIETFKPLVDLKRSVKTMQGYKPGEREFADQANLFFKAFQSPDGDRLITAWLDNLQKELDAAPQDEDLRIDLYKEVGALATTSPNGQKRVADFLASHLGSESGNVCQNGIAQALGALWMHYYLPMGSMEETLKKETRSVFLSQKAADIQGFQTAIQNPFGAHSSDKPLSPLENLLKSIITSASTGFQLHSFFPTNAKPTPESLAKARQNCIETSMAFADTMNHLLPEEKDPEDDTVGWIMGYMVGKNEGLRRLWNAGNNVSSGVGTIDFLLSTNPDLEQYLYALPKVSDAVVNQLTASQEPRLDDEALATLFAEVVNYHRRHDAALSDQTAYLEKILPAYKPRWAPFRADATDAEIHSIYGYQFLNVRDFLYSQAHGNLRQFVLKKNGNTPDPTLDTLAKKVTDASFEVFKYDLSIKLIQKMLQDNEMDVLSKNLQMLHVKMMDKMGLTTSDVDFRMLLTQTPSHQLLETQAAKKAEAVKNRQKYLNDVWQYHPQHPQSKSIHRPQ